MGRFVFYFASQAYYDAGRKAFPTKGVREYGDLAHKYKMPVTWLTNTEGAHRGKKIFTEFHEQYGDAVIVWGMPNTAGNTSQKRDFVLPLSETEIREYIQREQAGVKAELPWADIDHLGFFYRTPAAVRAMHALGVKSCYGHCWEMIATDGVTDNGTPWGFYLMDPEGSWKRPNPKPDPTGIIATEWLQHDLNKSWNFYGSCSVFSFDPNDVGRAKICDGRQIDYWREAFREYYRNRRWNEFIPFIFHQEAHEQESTPGGWEVVDQATVDNTYAMTDEFLKFITSGEFPDMEIMTLPQATEEYRKVAARQTLPHRTPPTYMRFVDIPIDMPVWNQRKAEVYAQFLDAKAEEEAEGGSLDIERDYGKFSYFQFPYGWQGMVYGPEKRFPESFVAVDCGAQLFFHRDRMTPVKMWNYHTPLPTDLKNLYFNEQLFAERDLPEIVMNLTPQFPEEFSKLRITIKSQKSMPYGLCFWTICPPSTLIPVLECGSSNSANGRFIGDDLVFVRIDVPAGTSILGFHEKA
jgi:hypothetical protein